MNSDLVPERRYQPQKSEIQPKEKNLKFEKTQQQQFHSPGLKDKSEGESSEKEIEKYHPYPENELPEKRQSSYLNLFVAHDPYTFN